MAIIEDGIKFIVDKAEKMKAFREETARLNSM